MKDGGHRKESDYNPYYSNLLKTHYDDCIKLKRCGLSALRKHLWKNKQDSLYKNKYIWCFTSLLLANYFVIKKTLPPKIQMPIKHILNGIEVSNLFQDFSVTSILPLLFPVLNSAICSIDV